MARNSATVEGVDESAVAEAVDAAVEGSPAGDEGAEKAPNPNAVKVGDDLLTVIEKTLDRLRRGGLSYSVINTGDSLMVVDNADNHRKFFVTVDEVDSFRPSR